MKIKFLTIILFSLLIMISFISKNEDNNKAQASGSSYNMKVLTIGIDPQENGTSLVTTHWGKTAEALESQSFNNTITAFKTLSSNRINYSIVKHVEINEFPKLPDGSRVFNLSSYNECVTSPTEEDIQNCEQKKWQFSYSKFFDDYNICQLANQYDVDEIWMITPPYIGKYESLYVGPTQSYFINGHAEINTNCEKIYAVMGPTYDRPENLMHNFGHRIESTIQYIFSYISFEDKIQHWSRFSGFDDQIRLCGNTHFPRNARYNYDYANNAANSIYCNDWKNFPNYNNSSEYISCNSWGCDDIGWQTYWLANMPSSSGQAKLRNYNNQEVSINKDWWSYVLNPYTAMSFVNSSINVAPAEVECTQFSYSQWGSCSSGIQTRSVVSYYPSGCSGGTPILSQECSSCTGYTYTPWSECVDSKQTRSIESEFASSCPSTEQQPLERECVIQCTEMEFSDFGECIDGQKSRKVVNKSPDNCEIDENLLSFSCEEADKICKKVTYGGWKECVDGFQTATITMKEPSTCIPENETISRACFSQNNGSNFTSKDTNNIPAIIVITSVSISLLGFVTFKTLFKKR